MQLRGALVLQSDGKIVVLGMAFNGSNYDIGVIRYNADGSRDSTFDGDGIALIDGGYNESSGDLTLDGSGRIVIAGGMNDGTSVDLMVVRLNSNGSRDNTFGTGGIARTPIGSGSSALRRGPDHARGPDSCRRLRQQRRQSRFCLGQVHLRRGIGHDLRRFRHRADADRRRARPGPARCSCCPGARFCWAGSRTRAARPATTSRWCGTTPTGRSTAPLLRAERW